MDRSLSLRRVPCPQARQRGAAVVEFAFTLALMITLLLGAAEVARALRYYSTVAKAVAAAARYLSQYPPNHATAIAEAKDIVVYGKPIPAAGDPPLLPGLLRRHVVVRDSTDIDSNKRQAVGTTGRINLVTVTVSGMIFVPMASWVLPAFTFGPVSVTMPQGAG